MIFTAPQQNGSEATHDPTPGANAQRYNIIQAQCRASEITGFIGRIANTDSPNDQQHQEVFNPGESKLMMQGLAHAFAGSKA